MENSEDAEYLAQVARQGKQIVAVIGKAGPLRFILDRGVPQERIAHRRIGRLDVLGNQIAGRRAEIQAGKLVVDHRHGVQPRRTPRIGRQRPRHQGMEAQIPGLQIRHQSGFVRWG